MKAWTILPRASVKALGATLCFFLFLIPSVFAGQALSRGLFVCVMQDPPVLASRAEIDKLIDFAQKARIHILFVQIYQSNQAWFPSKTADDRPYRLNKKNFSADPFDLLIKKAHQEGIQVHAWINLLSLGNNQNALFLKKYGPGILTRNRRAKHALKDYKIDDQYFLEPGDPRVRNDLTKIVEEIVRTYPDLDGLEFDYIRYPDVDPHYGYTPANIERFKKAAGFKGIEEKSPVWNKWRRGQVTAVLAQLAEKARSLRPDLRISSTGCMPYERAYYEAFQDWPSWLSTGLIDFVNIMNYSADPGEFERWLEAAQSKTTDFKKVNVAIGAYKLARSPQKFAQELRYCEEKHSTCVIFNYGSLRDNPELAKVLQGPL